MGLHTTGPVSENPPLSMIQQRIIIDEIISSVCHVPDLLNCFGFLKDNLYFFFVNLLIAKT